MTPWNSWIHARAAESKCHFVQRAAPDCEILIDWQRGPYLSTEPAATAALVKPCACPVLHLLLEPAGKHGQIQVDKLMTTHNLK